MDSTCDTGQASVEWPHCYRAGRDRPHCSGRTRRRDRRPHPPEFEECGKGFDSPDRFTDLTPEQEASAKKELCSTYQVAARSVDADTHSSDTALARISLANAAGMLDAAAANPALSTNDRDAARALASAYWVTNAVSSVTDASSPLYQTTLDDAKRAADAMAAICR